MPLCALSSRPPFHARKRLGTAHPPHPPPTSLPHNNPPKTLLGESPKFHSKRRKPVMPFRSHSALVKVETESICTFDTRDPVNLFSLWSGESMAICSPRSTKLDLPSNETASFFLFFSSNHLLTCSLFSMAQYSQNVQIT